MKIAIEFKLYYKFYWLINAQYIAVYIVYLFVY